MSACCPSCSEPLLAEDVNIQTGLGQCRQCNAVFNLVEHMTPEVRRREVPLPQSIRTDYAGGELRLTHRWYSWMAWLLLMFCVFWNGFLVVWYSIALREGASLMIFLFPIIHVLVGIGLTYYTLALFLNETTIDVSPGLLTIRHRPLPWYGDRTLGTAEIDQFYCTERIVRRKHGNSTHYQLHAILENQQKVTLLQSLGEVEQALFLEQQLEDYLQLADRPIAGEVPR